MADEAAMEKTKSPEGGKRRMLPLMIIAFLMLAEGVGIFFVAKIMFAPGPLEAVAENPPEQGPVEEVAQEELAVPETAEVDLADCRPSNKVTGKLITFRLRVSALVRASDAERAAALVKANQARINDRVNFVIRSADPHHLNEPGLETVKRRIKHELDGILGDEKLLLEILIPELLQS